MNYALKKILKGSAMIAATTLGAAVMGFLLRMILTRRLGVEEFGLFYAMIAFFGPIGLLKNLGVNRAIIKYMPEFLQAGDLNRTKEALHWGMIFSLGTSLIVALPLFFGAEWLGRSFFHHEQSPVFFRIMLVYFVLSTLGGVFSSFFNGLQRPFLLSSRALFTELIILVGAYCIAGLDLKDLCLIHVGAEGAVILFSAFMLLKIFPYFRTPSRLTLSGIGKLLSFGLKAITSPLVNRVFGRLDIILLTYFNNLSHVGFYSAAQPFSRLFTILGSSIGKIVMPYSSETFASGDRKSIGDTIRSLQRLMLFSLAPIAIVFFLFSSELLEIFFGRVYQAGSMVVRLLVGGTLIHSLTIIHTDVITGVGEPLKVTKLTTLNSVFNLCGNLLLIPLWGMNGAALSTLISYWIMFMGSCRYMNDLVGHAFNWKGLLKVIVASIAMLAFLKGAQVIITPNIWILLIVFVPVSLGVYGGAALALGLISRDELGRVLKRVKEKGPGFRGSGKSCEGPTVEAS